MSGSTKQEASGGSRNAPSGTAARSGAGGYQVPSSQDIAKEAIANRLRARLPRQGLPPETASTIGDPSKPELPPLAIARFQDAALPTVDAVTALPDQDFIQAAYVTLLGRAPDPRDLATYLGALRSGRLTKSEILATLSLLPEGREKNRQIAGLQRLQLRYRLTRIPVLGKLFWWAGALARLPRDRLALQAQLDQFVLQLSRRDDTLANEFMLRQTPICKLIQEAENTRQRIDALDKDVTRAANAVEQLNNVWAYEHGALDMSEFYAKFELAFRGTAESVSERLTVYDRWLDPNWLPPAELPILEIGCGRGLWLEHCRELGLKAYGVDTNKIAVAAGRGMGLDAREENALHHLRRLPAGSLRAVACFHVMEHLRFEEQYALLTEAARTLAPGGLLLVETPNPHNLIVGACMFWSDPSHLRPVFPATLEFAAKDRGFVRTEIITLHRFDAYQPDAIGTPVEQKWLFGEMDYALVAYTPELNTEAA